MMAGALQQHASILLIILPLLAAPVTALLNNGRIAWFITLIVTASCFFLSAQIFTDVITGSTIHYELGGWAPPWGIAYVVDALNALMALMVTMVGFCVAIYAWTSVDQDIPKEKQSLFYAAFQLCFLGLLGMALTGDIFNVFVFLEISSLATYALISMGRSRRALTAAFQYLIMGTIGATFFLIGIGLTYAATGSLNMADLSIRLAESNHAGTIHVGFAFIFIGLALKAAKFPLHQWLPNSYIYAPILVTAFLAGSATKVANYLVIRALFTVFKSEYSLETIVDEALIVFGSIAIIYGSWQAIRQTSVKPLLAWSSISQIGYFTVGIGLLSSTGLMATMIHVFNHALMKTALFMAAGALLYQTGTLRIQNLAGIAGRSRFVFVVIVIAGLSLIGVPGTVGFIGKWYLVLAAVEIQAWWLVAVVLIGSAMAIIYVWKIVEVMYFDPPDGKVVEVKDNLSLSLVIPMSLLAAGCIYLGFDTTTTILAAETAVNSMGTSDIVAGGAQ